MTRRFVLILITLLGCSLIPQFALAAEGRVLFVAGDAAIERGGQKLPAQKGMLIETGDVLATGPGGKLQWRMADDSYYAIRQNSRFEVKEYSAPQAADGGGKSLFNLLRGGVRVLTGLIGKGNPEAFKLNSPVATLGIRGTDFITIVCSGDCSVPSGAAIADGGYVKVSEGAIEASNPEGSATANAGEFITVNSPPQTTKEQPAVFVTASVDFDFQFEIDGGVDGSLRIETETEIQVPVSPN